MLTLLSKAISQKETSWLTGLEYVRKHFSDAESATYKKNDEEYRREYGDERARYLSGAYIMEMYLAGGYEGAKIFDREPPPPKPQKPVRANG